MSNALSNVMNSNAGECAGGHSMGLSGAKTHLGKSSGDMASPRFCVQEGLEEVILR